MDNLDSRDNDGLESSSPKEIDDLIRAIHELEDLISSCEPVGEQKTDATDFEELETPGSQNPFARQKKSGNEELPSQQEDKGPYRQLGTTQEGRTVRGPRVRNAKSRKRRSGVKTIRSDLGDVRRSKLASLTQANPGVTQDDGPVESRKTRIGFEEERAEERSSGGRELARATLIARALSALIFLLVVGSVVALAINTRNNSDDNHSNELTLLANELSGVMKSVRRAEETLEAFWNAPTMSTKLAHVWQAERVSPLMEDYYESHILPTAGNFGSARILSNRTRHFHSEVPSQYVVASVDDHVGVVHDFILRLEGSDYLVDWEASVGYNASQLSKLINLRHPEPVTLRVLITPASYYNYQYSDQRVYQSFAISVNGFDEPNCYAFAERQSDVAKSLMRFFANRAQRKVAVTLEMRFPMEGDSGAELLSLVSPHWVSPER